MTDNPILLLEAHGQSLCVLPGVGGTIGHWRDGDIDLLRPADAEAIVQRSPRQTGCYPLIPFSGRVRAGLFHFEGAPVRLALNFAPETHAIHGSAWMNRWSETSRGIDRLRIELNHPPGPNWPWRYEAWQEFRLSADGLTVEIGLRNTDEKAFPAGIGLHPYFHRDSDTRMTARLGGVWQYDSVLIPVKHERTPAKWDFSAGRLVDPVRVDHTFTDIGGPIEIVWPHLDRGVRIAPDPVFDKFVVFIPDGRPYFCVEPVTIMPDAFDRPASDRPGFRVLAPGESFSGAVQFQILRGVKA
ncbi:MAG: aldose 1-epimerase [Elsteraceae bacterium]